MKISYNLAMSIVTLAELAVGQKARVLGFLGHHTAYHHQLMLLGLIKGCELSVVHKAPLGDPIAIEISGLCVALRQREAACLYLERVDTMP